MKEKEAETKISKHIPEDLSTLGGSSESTSSAMEAVMPLPFDTIGWYWKFSLEISQEPLMKMKKTGC